MQLNERLQKAKLGSVTWIETKVHNGVLPTPWNSAIPQVSADGSSRSTNSPVTGWRMQAIVSGTVVGQGEATTKARAKNIAAAAALKALFDIPASSKTPSARKEASRPTGKPHKAAEPTIAESVFGFVLLSLMFYVGSQYDWPLLRRVVEESRSFLERHTKQY